DLMYIPWPRIWIYSLNNSPSQRLFVKERANGVRTDIHVRMDAKAFCHSVCGEVIYDVYYVIKHPKCSFCFLTTGQRFRVPVFPASTSVPQCSRYFIGTVLDELLTLVGHVVENARPNSVSDPGTEIRLMVECTDKSEVIPEDNPGVVSTTAVE